MGQTQFWGWGTTVESDKDSSSSTLYPDKSNISQEIHGHQLEKTQWSQNTQILISEIHVTQEYTMEKSVLGFLFM